MSALTKQRTPGLKKTLNALDALVGADAKIFKGALCGFKGGYLFQWTADADLQHPCIAIPEELTVVDNTGGNDGDLVCTIEFIREKTTYLFANDSGSPLVQANIGGSAYGLDDQTVSASDSSATRARVGTPWIIQGTNSMGYRTGVYVEFDAADPMADVFAILASIASGKGLSLLGLQDAAGRFTAANGETAFAEIGGRIIGAAADETAIEAIPAATRVNGMICIDLTNDVPWIFDSGSAAAASAWVLEPDAGTGRWLRNCVSLADLASVATGFGASLIGVDATNDDLETALAAVKATADAAPSMQAVDATLATGTISIATGITVAADSEVIPLLVGDISGSANFASLRERKASRVNGAPGVGTVVVDAVADDGQLDADAAGAIRVVILTPQV